MKVSDYLVTVLLITAFLVILVLSFIFEPAIVLAGSILLGLGAGRMVLGVFADCGRDLDSRGSHDGDVLYGRRHLFAGHTERLVEGANRGGFGIVECAQAQTTTKATPTTFYLRYLTHRLLRYNQVK